MENIVHHRKRPVILNPFESNRVFSQFSFFARHEKFIQRVYVENDSFLGKLVLRKDPSANFVRDTLFILHMAHCAHQTELQPSKLEMCYF